MTERKTRDDQKIEWDWPPGWSHYPIFDWAEHPHWPKDGYYV